MHRLRTLRSFEAGFLIRREVSDRANDYPRNMPCL
jgi:hypothetical protein